MRPWQSRFAGLILVNLCLYRLSDVFRELGTSNVGRGERSEPHQSKTTRTVRFVPHRTLRPWLIPPRTVRSDVACGEVRTARQSASYV